MVRCCWLLGERYEAITVEYISINSRSVERHLSNLYALFLWKIADNFGDDGETAWELDALRLARLGLVAQMQ